MADVITINVHNWFNTTDAEIWKATFNNGVWKHEGKSSLFLKGNQSGELQVEHNYDGIYVTYKPTVASHQAIGTGYMHVNSGLTQLSLVDLDLFKIDAGNFPHSWYAEWRALKS
jgi:hypothetical protein